MEKRRRDEMALLTESNSKIIESNDDFKLVTSTGNAAIIMLNNLGKVSFWNNAAERVFGYTNREVKGKYLSTLILPESDQDSFNREFDQFRKTTNGMKVSQTFEKIGVKKDRTTIDIEITLSAVSIKDDWNAVAIIKDISESKKKVEIIKELKSNQDLILSNVYDSVIIISKDMKIIFMNRKAEEEFGSHLRFQTCYEVLMNKTKACEECSFNRLITNYSENTRFETSIIKPLTSEKKYYECSCTPILNINGKPAIIDIIRDITYRKVAEQILRDSKEKFRKLVENFPYSIFLLDFNQIISDCNSVAELYLNKPIEEITNKYFFDIFPTSEDQIEIIGEIIHNAFDYDLNEMIEIDFINKNNNTSWVELFFSSVNIGNKKYIQVILQDITERKLAEKIIKEENLRLRKIDMVKKQLTVKTSEELKSPLTNMFDASKILLDSYTGKLDQKAIKLLELIKKGGEQSMNLVGRLVDISRIESEKIIIKKQVESLTEIIRESVDELMVEIKNQTFNLNIDLLEDLYSKVDKLRMKQVITDILLHIMKNTSEKSEITLYLQKNGNFADLIIKNKEINLKEKEKKVLFFNRNKINPKNSFLGLYFSTEIIDLHGGQIIIESKGEHDGTKFIIRLPRIDWTDSLLHIYIFYQSGILLYDQSYEENARKSDSILISGGLVGMMAILKEVVQGEKSIKIIDHGDRKIIFKKNKTKEIIFALIVKKNLMVFHQKLFSLIEEFDKSYKDCIETIQESCSVGNNWTNLESLIKHHLG